MEKNLNVAPTEQELDNAGFVKARQTGMEKEQFSYIKQINDNLILIVEGSDTGIWYKSGNKANLIHPIEPTKAAINAEFEHFNQPLPQWEKPKPKVGEVYHSSSKGVFFIQRIKNAHATCVKLSLGNYENFSACLISFTGYKKLADTLDEYYNQERQNKTKPLKTVVDDGIIKDEPKPHQYSYKGLKADGKIPHDMSGEDHESIEALKKLLAICEALNGEFDPEWNGAKYRPFWEEELESINCIIDDFECNYPYLLNSEQAFEAFRSAPENIELFKKFLKIK